MTRFHVGLMSLVAVTTIASSITTPAFALGGCGRNGHRNAYGYCVFGGQNQDYCLRRTGHPAVRMPNGTMRCF